MLNEISYSSGILDKVSGGESLVGGVEEWVKLLLFHNLSDLLPLFHSWVNSGGVVCTRVEQDPASLLGLLEVLNHSLEVESSSGWVVVGIFNPVEAGSLDDGVVVSPRWLGDEDFSWDVVGDEFESNSEGSSSGQGLGGSNL